MRVGPLSIGAAAVALALTGLVLSRAAPPAPEPLPVLRPIAIAPSAPIDEATVARLFAAAVPAKSAAPADAPAVAGIVGRLPDDAVVLVRRGDGPTHKLALGEAVDGWRLEAISRDAVLFTRGDRRVRVSPGETSADQ